MGRPYGRPYTSPLTGGEVGWVAGRVFVVYGAPLDVCYERWSAPYGRGGGDGSEGG